MAGTTMVLDANTRQVVKTIRFEIPGVSNDLIQPVGVVIDQNRDKAYVALGPANRVAMLPGRKIFIGRPTCMELGFFAGSKAFIYRNGVSNDISIIDLEKQQVVKSIGVGRYPWGIAVKP